MFYQFYVLLDKVALKNPLRWRVTPHPWLVTHSKESTHSLVGIGKGSYRTNIKLSSDTQKTPKVSDQLSFSEATSSTTHGVRHATPWARSPPGKSRRGSDLELRRAQLRVGAPWIGASCERSPIARSKRGPSENPSSSIRDGPGS